MFEKIIALDKQLIVYLNNLGSKNFDWFWLLATKQFNWAPIFIFVFYILYKKLGLKKFGWAIFFIALIILFADQTANLFKNSFERVRPCNDLSIVKNLRIYWDKSGSFSFFSGHATNSMATALFVYLLLKPYYKNAFLLFLFPLIFAYSRIYLGLHFPLDILTGYLFGAIYGFIFYKIFQKKILFR
ncbi:phosphatase PAP2 family protein [Flavobacterium croceum]|uniref:phosphatase PAP2 family protein n=1 Tax=Flavobacterium croceum TaxID=370975 RepID=UPI0024A9EBDC|nr:phosphatase PAP2 family protein [Flavobacterium croceum]